MWPLLRTLQHPPLTLQPIHPPDPLSDATQGIPNAIIHSTGMCVSALSHCHEDFCLQGKNTETHPRPPKDMSNPPRLSSKLHYSSCSDIRRGLKVRVLKPNRCLFGQHFWASPCPNAHENHVCMGTRIVLERPVDATKRSCQAYYKRWI